MAVNPQQVLDLLIRKETFMDQMRDLVALVDADGESVSDVIGRGEAYSERAARTLVDDILAAYDAYPDAVAALESQFDNIDEAFGDPFYQSIVGGTTGSYLDAMQRQLLSSMLYCLLRLVGESPWYDGTFGEFEAAVTQLLDSFGHNVPKTAFWVNEIESEILGASPAVADDVAGRVDMVNAFPMVGAHGYFTFNDDWPVWFLDDLNSVYEMLSGKLVAQSLSPEVREKIAGDPANFASLKDEERLFHLGKEQVERAYAQGWLDDADRENWESMNATLQEAEANYRRHEAFDDIDQLREARAERFARRIERWTRDFPNKDAWCAEYVAMREAYFALEGLKPLDGVKPTEETWRFPMEIQRQWLIAGIEAVLDDRGFSHYNDDAYNEICGHLLQAANAVKKLW